MLTVCVQASFCQICSHITFEWKKRKTSALVQLTANGKIVMLNKNTWNVKKVQGQEEPATKNSDIK